MPARGSTSKHAIQSVTLPASNSATPVVRLSTACHQVDRGSGHGPAAATTASDYTADSEAPALTGFDFEMPTLAPPIMLTLSFSETVNASSLNVSGIVLQSTNLTADSSVRLTSALVSVNSTHAPSVLHITVSATDLAAIRALESMGRTAATTFVSLDNTAVSDFAGNAVDAIAASSALTVTTRTVDITPPTVSSFNLNMQSNQLVITFDEPVVLSTFEVESITLLSAQNSSAASYTLTGGSTSASNNDVTITVTLNTIDINAIKADQDLAVDQASPFLSIAAATVADIAENDIDAVAVLSAIRVTTYTQDTAQHRRWSLSASI